MRFKKGTPPKFDMGTCCWVGYLFGLVVQVRLCYESADTLDMSGSVVRGKFLIRIFKNTPYISPGMPQTHIRGNIIIKFTCPG